MFRKFLYSGLLYKSSCVFKSSLNVSTHVRTVMERVGLPWVSVFTSETDDRLQISFIHPECDVVVKSRTYNFNRAKNESLQATLARVEANVSKVVNKKKNKKRRKNGDGDDAASNEGNGRDLNIRMYRDGYRLTEDITNEAAWLQNTVLEVDGAQYVINVNPPVCRSINLSSIVMEGYPLYPEIDVAWCNLEDCQCSWQRTVADGEEMGSPDTPSPSSASAENKWIEISTKFQYCPTTADVGQDIKLVITPVRGELVGNPYESQNYTVQSGPSECLFEKRHQLTTQRCSNGRFRVVSYNILADLYASSEHSERILYPYCRKEHLAFSYRKQLVAKEILGYNADILCLQEVDQKFFVGSLSGIMAEQGYGGLLTVKPLEVAEGTATFYRKDRFREVSNHDMKDMMEAFRSDPIYADVLNRVNAVEPLAEIVHSRKTEVQVTVLEAVEDPKKKLLVATTHLYFHPIYNNVRMIQTIIALRHIEKIKQLYQEKGEEVAVIFCGDFNAGPISGTVQLITRGSVPTTHANWWAAGREQHIGDLHLQHSLRLSSASGYPEYTNYVRGFHGCLDHIFIDDDRLVSERVIPLPEHDDIVRYTALPNETAPSDHLALVCDLAWKQ